MFSPTTTKRVTTRGVRSGGASGSYGVTPDGGGFGSSASMTTTVRRAQPEKPGVRSNGP